MVKQIYKNDLRPAPELSRLFETLSIQYLFVAPNAPHRAIVVSNYSGNYQLHAVDFESGFHRQVTNKEGGTLFGSISSDGQYIYWLDDQAGGEYGNFVKAPFKGGKTINITPNLKPYFSYSISSSNNGEMLGFTATIKNKNKIFSLQAKKNDTYKSCEIYSSNSYLSETICSTDGKYICVAETNAQTKLSSFILLSSENKGDLLRSKLFGDAIPLSFLQKSKNPTILALIKINNWLRPILYNFENNRVFKIHHKYFCGDVWVLKWNEEQQEMILCDVYKARQKLYRYNIKTKKLEQIGPQAGSFNFHFNSAICLNDNSLILKWHDFNTSPRLIQIIAPRYKWKEINQWSGDIKSRYKVQNVLARSSDDENVQMWVVLPRGKKKNLSFVIDIHGGPDGVVGNEFSPEAQAWLTSGFGYCAVNYRGSIGFGQKFEKKIYGNPGYWEVEDVVAVRNWLVDNKYANSKNIILCGWSWGGYIVLLALGKYPNLWNCGIAGAAITDFIKQYIDEPAYFKTQDQEKFGGTPKTVRARYVRSSPITYVENIQAPILLMHGKNDVRCPPRQIKDFVKRLKKLNKIISVKWFTSGHTGEFTNTSLRLELMNKVLDFARQQIKNTPQK